MLTPRPVCVPVNLDAALGFAAGATICRARNVRKSASLTQLLLVALIPGKSTSADCCLSPAHSVPLTTHSEVLRLTSQLEMAPSSVVFPGFFAP